ncbi:MAG: YihY family inner membrane protein [Candidatus Altiarchaeales archaeon]|nr:YihY family inner membrane protein [Candidatus Altiarchaeales archaeon]MBD3416886.1 YihY family inner membrane protein [Candidatus Altiarchaeales archaeon]
MEYDNPRGGRDIVYVLKETAVNAVENQIPMLSAALSFYILVSLAPLMLILLNLMGYVFNLEDPENAILAFFKEYMISSGELPFMTVGENYELLQGNTAFTLLGLGILFWTSTRVFNHLQYSLNRIWDVDERARLGLLVKKRLLSFLLILALGSAIFVFSTVQGVLIEFEGHASEYLGMNAYSLQFLSNIISMAMTAALFYMLFKFIPDAHVPGKSALWGGLIASMLFFAGQIIAAYYFSLAGIASAYGAAGSLIVFLLWVYYSSQIFLVGAQFTRSYSSSSEVKS